MLWIECVPGNIILYIQGFKKYFLSLETLQSFFDDIICDIVQFAFVVDGKQVDVIAGDANMGDDASGAGFSFSFGGDGQAFFGASVA
jgi:hypothetical protein